MSNQDLPVKLKVLNSVFIQYSVFNMYFYFKTFLSSLQYIIIYRSEYIMIIILKFCIKYTIMYIGVSVT